MRRITVLVLLVVAAQGPGAAQAFELLRVNRDPCSAAQNLFWIARSVTVSGDLLPFDLQPLAIEARARWNQSVSGFEFRSGSGPSCAVDGVTNLAFSDRPCGGDPGDFNGIVAITRSVWRSNGELVDADILFNENGLAARNNDVFLEVSLHELGHVLGLDHSDSCGQPGTGTLMKAVLGFSERILFPQPDDIEGADFIYPSGGNGGVVPEDANSCALTSAPRGWFPALPFLAIPPLLIARRRLLQKRVGKTIDEPGNLL